MTSLRHHYDLLFSMGTSKWTRIKDATCQTWDCRFALSWASGAAPARVRKGRFDPHCQTGSSFNFALTRRVDATRVIRRSQALPIVTKVLRPRTAGKACCRQGSQAKCKRTLGRQGPTPWTVTWNEQMLSFLSKVVWTLYRHRAQDETRASKLWQRTKEGKKEQARPKCPTMVSDNK